MVCASVTNPAQDSQIRSLPFLSPTIGAIKRPTGGLDLDPTTIAQPYDTIGTDPAGQ